MLQETSSAEDSSFTIQNCQELAESLCTYLYMYDILMSDTNDVLLLCFNDLKYSL